MEGTSSGYAGCEIRVSQKLTTLRSVTELLLHNLLIQANMLVYTAVRTGTQKALQSFD